MKPWITPSLLLLMGCWAFAEPLTLVNTLPTRPVFTMLSQGVTVTRTVAPGNKVLLEAGLFSGLGDKRVPLVGGTVYYLARFGGTPGLYQLPSDQALVLNQSGRAIALTLWGQNKAQGLLATGALALGAQTKDKSLKAVWDDGTGTLQSKLLSGGTVYRLVLETFEEVGTTVSLVPWR